MSQSAVRRLSGNTATAMLLIAMLGCLGRLLRMSHPDNTKTFYYSAGKKALLEKTKDFTVLVKNTIKFPDLGPKYIRRNIVEKPYVKHKEAYLQNCIYEPKTDPYCPTFRIGDIVERAGFKYADVAKTAS